VPEQQQQQPIPNLPDITLGIPGDVAQEMVNHFLSSGTGDVPFAQVNRWVGAIVEAGKAPINTKEAEMLRAELRNVRRQLAGYQQPLDQPPAPTPEGNGSNRLPAEAQG
jgi:hypothetical protein